MNQQDYSAWSAMKSDAAPDREELLRKENAHLQALLYQQAEDAGYAYELMNSLLRGTIKVSNAAGRAAIRKAMARLIRNDAPPAKEGK